MEKLPEVPLQDTLEETKPALDVARIQGVVEESVLRFADRYSALSQNSFNMLASRHRLMAYINLGRDVWTWIQWLKNQGPIIARLDADRSWMEIDSGGNLQVYQRPYYGGHAVCIVGFKNGRFIIRNSWGQDWGQQGFAFVSIVYAMSSLTEAFGILGVHCLPTTTSSSANSQ